MADSEVDEAANWPVEDIPREDSLFLRFHQQWLTDGELSTGLFADGADGGMSTDWSKYSSAEETRARAKKPAVNGVAVLSVADVLDIPQQVQHAPVRTIDSSRTPPILPNRAHTNVIGAKTLEVRLKLSRLAQIAIPPTK